MFYDRKLFVKYTTHIEIKKCVVSIAQWKYFNKKESYDKERYPTSIHISFCLILFLKFQRAEQSIHSLSENAGWQCSKNIHRFFTLIYDTTCLKSVLLIVQI